MSESVPRVTIGLPVYNGENYLAEAIESLLSQTFTDFELVICDNGSTDRTEQVCRAFAARDARIRYYRESQNRGLAWNFSRTFELARGRYFKWQAHDDLCGPTLLERSVEALDRDPALVLACARRTIIDHDGALVPDDPASYCPETSPGNRSAGSRSANLASASASRRLRGVLLQSVWNFEQFGLIRTSALAATGGMRGYVMSDWVLMVELALRGSFYEIPEALFFPRRHARQNSLLPTPAAQQNIARSRRRALVFPVPRHVRPTVNYCRAVWSAPIGWGQRIACWTVIIRYVFRVRKWKGIVVNTLRDFKFSRQLNAAPKTSEPAPVSRAPASANIV